MTKLKKMMINQSIAMVLSFVAFVFSIYALISVNKIKNSIDIDFIQREGVFKPIKKVPDVEIVNKDGSIQQVNAVESKDPLGKLLEEKANQKNVDNDKNAVNNARHKGDQGMQKDGKTGNNAVEKSIHQNYNNGENDKKEEKNGKSINKSLDKKPISRDNSKTQSRIDKSEGNKQLNVADENKDKSKISNQTTNNNHKISIDINKNKVGDKNSNQSVVKGENGINGAYVVQVSALKDRLLAEKQCKKIAGKIGNKKCGISTTNNQFFRVIIYPFNSEDEASKFTNRLSANERIYGFVKKNS